MAADDLSAAPRRLHDRYILVRRLAEGGMAEVWEGRDEVLARAVAVKLLRPHLALDPDVRARFRREAVAAARLSHPNVVAIYDTGEEGQPFIVMELVEGPTLRHVLDERGPLPPALAVTIAIEVARALAPAHEAGIVHRDIKPGNILVLQHGTRLEVKVSDFGIARAADLDHSPTADGMEPVTDPGTVVGTMKYIAPEAVEGVELDGRADIYALGVVLYEMLTGRAPFAGDSPLATATARLTTDPPRPREVRAGIPRSLEAVVLKAMARHREERYQRAGDLVAALAATGIEADDAVPLVARHPTPPGGVPTAFAATERRWLVPALLIVVAAAVLGLGGWMFRAASPGRGLLDRPSAADANRPIAIVAAATFDPERDGRENDDRLPALLDADPGTTWVSDRYSSREFGGLKSGLGLVFETDGSQPLLALEIESPSQGWSARTYVAREAAAGVAGWGEPTDTQEEIEGTTRFDLRARTGRFVLVWFTRLPAGNRMEVGGAKLLG